MECRRHRTGAASDEIPRGGRRTRLARHNQTDLDCGTGRVTDPKQLPGQYNRRMANEAVNQVIVNYYRDTLNVRAILLSTSLRW